MCMVDLPTGRLSLSVTDVELPGPIPFALTRQYRSTNIWRGELGHGWSHSLGVVLWEDAEALWFRDADGRRIPFPRPTAAQPVAQVEGMALLRLTRDELPTALAPDLPAGAHALQRPDEPTLFFDVHPRRGRFPWRALGDRSGNVIRVETDDLGNAVQIRTPAAVALEMTRTREGQLAAVRFTDATRGGSGRVILRYEYDARGDLVSVHDSGGTRRYEYDAEHRLLRHVDRTGGTCDSEYDALGRCVMTGGPGGVHTRRYDFDPDHGTTRVTDGLGAVSTYRYDASQSIVETVDPAGGVSRFEYDQAGRLVLVTDQLGRETVLLYDDRGLQIGKIGPDGAATSLERDALGEVTRAVSATGVVTSYDRDATGRVVGVMRPGDGRVGVTYAADGRVAAVQLPNGHVVSLLWSSDSRVLGEADDLGPLTTQHFDAFGRLRRLEVADGGTTEHRYDDAGHLAEIIHPDGASRRYRFDAEGRLVEVTDEVGHRATLAYDEAGRCVAVQLANGDAIRAEYDLEDRLISVHGPDGLWHRYTYDARGLVRRQQFCDGRVEEYAFDAVGRLAVFRDASGAETTVERDPAGRLRLVRYPDGTERSIEHDADGRWVSVRWAGHELAREFDEHGRVVSERQDDYLVSREYGPDGALAALVDSLGRRVEYRSTPAGRLAAMEVTDGRWDQGEWIATTAPRVHRFEWDRAGNLVEWQTPGSVSERRRYDARRQLVEQVVATPGGVVLTRTYAYDPAGRLVRMADSVRGEFTFAYDAIGRLASVRHGGTVTDLSYSRAGDPLLNGLQYAPGHRVRSVRGEPYTFDARGFVCRRGAGAASQELDYTTMGLLREVRGAGGSSVRYEHDSHARLVAVTAGTERTRYHWNEGQLWAMRRADGLLVRYLHLPGGVVPIEETVGTRVMSLHGDQLGTAVNLVDETGTLVWTNPAGPWGEGRVSGKGKAPGDESVFGLPGQVWDPHTESYANRYRFYDPTAVHYLTPDPVGLWGGLDAYRYVLDPVNYTDPDGLKCRGKNDDPELYRGDKRAPDVVCKEGFVPRNPAAGLTVAQHVEGVPATGSNWISTTHDKKTAETFAGDQGVIFVIDNPGCGVEVDCDPVLMQKYGSDPPGSEHEIAFNKAIPPANVKGFICVATGQFKPC